MVPTTTLVRRGLLSLCLLAACAPGKSALERVDPLDGSRIVYLAPTVLDNARMDEHHRGYLTVVVERVQMGGDRPRFDFRIYCGSRPGQQMKVPPGNALNLWIDGKRTSYTTAAGSITGLESLGARKPEKPYVLFEDIQPDDLAACARAGRVQLQVRGEFESVTGDWSAKDLARLRSYLAAVEPDHASKP